VNDWVARIQAILNRLPGPGKLFFGNLTADHTAFRSLTACLLAIFAVFLTPPVISLGWPPIEQGLREIGSGVPILVAASYLLLAILTLIAGVSGDSLGHKRLLEIGLGGVLLAQVASVFWLGAPGFFYAELLLNMARIAVTPMCIALAAFTFTPGVRPFAYGAIFSTQAIALGLSSAHYSVLKSFGYAPAAFVLPITLSLLALWMIRREVAEPVKSETISWHELIINLLWTAAIFMAVYGLVASAGGLTSRNALLAIGIGLGGLVLVYRHYEGRGSKRGKLQLYNVRGLAFAILAAITAAMVQGVLFFQFWTYYLDVRGLGPVGATLQFAPFIIGMLVGTMLIVRLSTRFGAHQLIAAGLLLAAGGLLALSRLGVDTPFFYLMFAIALIGFGLGLAGPARTSVILSAPPPRLIGTGAGINAAAGQSGNALGVIVSSLLVTTLADSVLRRLLAVSSLSPAVKAQLDSLWVNAFARAMSGGYLDLGPEATLWLRQQFAPAFTAGLAETLLILAVIVATVAVFIWVGMERGLQGSLIQPPTIQK
jgi:MFS family permease